jgi:predicted nuclease with TOPRIM domain
MEPQTATGMTGVLVPIAVAVVAAVFGIQKLLKGWKESSTESSVITIMHTELERMARQNTTLTTELNKLQIELVTLNSELRKLTLENQQLHAEVAALTAQVTHLQATLRGKGE